MKSVQTEYGEFLGIFPFSVWMRENTDQKNSEYGNFSRSVLGNENAMKQISYH